MDKNITTILTELYALDPQLKAHEQQLLAIISRLLTDKPKIKLDRAFVKKLRAELMAEAREQSTLQTTTNHSFMTKIYYAFGGAVLAALLIIPTFYALKSLPAVTDGSLAIQPGLSITQLGEQAFGALVAEGLATNALAQREAPPAGLGGGAPVAAPLMATDSAIAVDSDQKVSAMPAIYPITIFKHMYVGEDVVLDQDKMEVLRRDSAALGSSSAASLLGKLNFGLADFSALRNSEIRNLTLAEKGSNGFSASVDFTNGTISINKEFWGDYSNPQPLTANDVPGDSELIDIANQFVKRFGVNLTGYGNPKVQNNWQRVISSAPVVEMYVPDTLTVVYPLEINGIRVYDLGGSLDGLMVNINVRTREAVGLYNLAVQSYNSSLYTVKTDIEALLNRLNTQQFPSDIAVETIEIKLGTPQLGLTKIWHYDGQIGYELLVPAYIFPVTEKPAEYSYYSDTVIVPLATDLLDSGYGGGIMPMLKGETRSTPPSLPLDDPGVMIDAPAAQ